MHVQACLCARKDGESSFHHCGGLVKLVHGCFWSRKDRESNCHHRGDALKHVQACLRGDEECIFCLVWRCYDSRTCQFRCQERWRKQFSQLWRSCEASARLFLVQERSRKQFSSP